MKKFSMFMVVCLPMFLIISCVKDDDLLDENLHKSNPQSLNEGEAKYNPAYTEYDVSPSKFGKPNSTNFTFRVQDMSGSQPLSVKFFERATGTVNIIPMTRIGTDWVLTKQMINNGWFDYRYVYSSTGNPISSTLAKELYATNNTFSSTGTSKITWPFDADGSSFINRLGWKGARESGGCGQKWYTDYTGIEQAETGHKYYSCNADDRFAEDWNKHCGNNYADDGAEVQSPLDGKVIKVTVDSPSNHWGGYGNSIDIEQVTVNGTYIFRIAHLKYPPTVSENTWVKAGVTKIGNIGMTGGTSSAPHAHMVVYKKNSCYDGMKFSLNAN